MWDGMRASHRPEFVTGSVASILEMGSFQLLHFSPEVFLSGRRAGQLSKDFSTACGGGAGDGDNSLSEPSGWV